MTEKKAFVLEADGIFTVRYADHEGGLFLITGQFSSREAAEARANEMETAEIIGSDMLIGDMT